jgi:formylglycine-generating enzyme required for sulfatase activity
MICSARLLWCAAILSFGCVAEPGNVSIGFEWGDGEPAEAIWIFGRIVHVDPDTRELGQTLAELAEPQDYNADMSFKFSEVPNGDNLAIVLEVRKELTADAHIFWYGISEPFSLSPEEEVNIDVSVVMAQAPVISSLVIEGAVGPDACPTCYVATNVVNLTFDTSNAVAVEVANSNDFAACKQKLVPGDKPAEGPNLSKDGANWRIDEWDLDCGLADTEDGPRTVFVRLLDAKGYSSQTLSNQVVLDRQPPTGGTLTCADGGWLFSLEPGGLNATMLFGVVKADEMWVEACEPGVADEEICVTVDEGLISCDAGSEHQMAIGEWTTFDTQGCVRLKDDTIRKLRVKYRDFARNETLWVNYEFENVVELVMPWILVPGGTFLMGCSPNDSDCWSSEKPAHMVTVSAFDVLETEVTEAQYEMVTGKIQSCDIDASGPNSPVECIDWFEARAFCEAVGGRLCTEAEWEYAARGGTTTTYHCGDGVGCVDGVAWYGSNSGGHKHEVKQKAPNGFGLYDMSGNVWEWVEDCWHKNYDLDGDGEGDWEVGNPDWSENCGTSRVSRGGSANSGDVRTLRVSNRLADPPSAVYGDAGGRCCRSPEP